MIINRLNILITGLLLCSFLTFNAFGITWNEAVNLGEKNSKEILSAKKQLEAAEWNYRKSYAPVLPQLSASAGMSETTNDGTTEATRSYSTSVSLSQTIFGGLENLYDIQSSYADLEYQKANFTTLLAAYYYDLRSAYIDVMVDQENTELSRQILKQRKDNTKLIQLRYESGKEDLGNYMTTKADQANSEYEYSAARRQLNLSKLKLSQLLQSEVTDVENPDKPSNAGDPDLNKIIYTTPTYIMVQKQYEKYDISQKKSISGYLPSLSISASRRASGDEWPASSGSNSWGWNLSYSLFPGGSNYMESIITSAQLDQAKADLNSSINSLRYDLEDALSNYRNALEALDVAKIQLEASKERANITQAKYMNGLVTYDEWYRIENTYIQAQKNMLSALKSAYQAEALWYKTNGGWIR